jgi:hypothetical protein|tara:strand:+ start:554 stop:736 length:183 start_codon:yes stop_codon:yes gene_type:complete
MNLVEIKNATRSELLEHLESYGLRVYPDESMKTLRSEAQELYWETNRNEGFSEFSLEENY